MCSPVERELGRYELVNNRSLVDPSRLKICRRSEDLVPAISSLHRAGVGGQVGKEQGKNEGGQGSLDWEVPRPWGLALNGGISECSRADGRGLPLTYLH